MTSTSRRVVISAVNFSEGGPLTVLIECLSSAAQVLGSEWDIIALVHDAELFSHPRVRTVAFPHSKRSWKNRLALEWGGGFMEFSRQFNPDLWLSLHDITPRVQARRQVVYCHNPSPFYQLSWQEARLEPSFALFNAFYSSLYRTFIQRNQMVIVQQEWLRNEFRKRYKHPCVVVAHPAVSTAQTITAGTQDYMPEDDGADRLVFLYPALPRVFKNIELLCEAVAGMTASVQQRIEMRLTIDGTENPYARNIAQQYAGVTGIRFIGRQNRAQMALQYARCDAVMFPSRLETWGLPITEAKNLGKPLLVADLPYARETTGTYDRVSFLPAYDARAWADAMAQLVDGRWHHPGQVVRPPAPPFVEGWASLWQLLVKDL